MMLKLGKNDRGDVSELREVISDHKGRNDGALAPCDAHQRPRCRSSLYTGRQLGHAKWTKATESRSDLSASRNLGTVRSVLL